MLHNKTVKSVLNKHKKRDDWFLDDYSVNPYEGCSCNCLYCYIRGSKYGENMEEKLSVKINALEVLEKQLRSRAGKGQYGIVAVGTGTDAYMHHEAQFRMTEGMLKLMLKYRFPVFISTKSTLITRDIDILKEIDRSAILPPDLKPILGRGVIVSVSISSMDERVCSMLEPGAALPSERLNTLKQLKQAGFLAGVNAIPVLPFISDSNAELEKIIAASKEHDADYILVGGLTLFGKEPADSKPLYYKFLERYDSTLLPEYERFYGNYPYPPRQYHEQLKKKATVICEKYNLRTSIIKKDA